MFPNQNIYDPRGPIDMNNLNNDNFFVSVDQYKKKRCHQNCIKCAAFTLFCVGLNSLSFYLGYKYANNEDSSHSN